MKKLVITLFLIVLSISLINSLSVNIPTGVSAGNYSLVNVNNSIYWQSHTGTDGSWLTGISTFNTTYNSKADYQFTNNNFNGSGNFTTTSYGFFGWLGSITSRITKLWAQDIDVSGTIKTYNINITNGTTIWRNYVDVNGTLIWEVS